MLEIKNMTVCYSGHAQPAVEKFNLNIKKGDICSIVGESGSGKSTMMKCLYFDQDITSGAAYLSTYKEGKANIFEETSQQKRYIRNYVMGMVYHCLLYTSDAADEL